MAPEYLHFHLLTTLISIMTGRRLTRAARAAAANPATNQTATSAPVADDKPIRRPRRAKEQMKYMFLI